MRTRSVRLITAALLAATAALAGGLSPAGAAAERRAAQAGPRAAAAHHVAQTVGAAAEGPAPVGAAADHVALTVGAAAERRLADGAAADHVAQTVGSEVAGHLVLGGGAAAAERAAGARAAAAPADYLALGDSVAAGYQPGRGDGKRAGFSGPVAAATGLRLTNLACTGETAATMMSGGRCRYRAGSQLAQARGFLAAHPRTALVTVSIGANDLRRCVVGTRAQVGCVEDQVRLLGERLPGVLQSLRAAAPNARLIVLDYYNPYLAAQAGGASRLTSINSTLLQFRLNTTIGEAARVSGARVARVASAFDSTDVWPREVAGLGRMPTNRARICTWTWMCSRADIHPNDAGYRVIARAVLDRR